MTRPDVICLGEAMVELSLDGPPPGPAEVRFAGDTFNTAVYLKRSAPTLSVAFATMLGRDRFSDALVHLMEEEGLDTQLVRRSDTRLPGLYAISTDASGERSFSYWRDRSAARTMFDDGGLRTDELDCDLLYYSAITLAILPPERRRDLLGWLPLFRASGGRVAFDSNYRPALWPDRATARADIGAAWCVADIALPSLDDEMAIFGDADSDAVLTRLRDCGPTTGALKRGAAGPCPLDGTAAGPFPTAARVVDSTAAGDSFNAGYLAALLAGQTEARAMQAGHTLASSVVGARGAILPRSAGAT